MCKQAGFEGFYSNHSLRATATTRLFNQGVDEQLICETTGHRSNAVRSYKRTSDEQKNEISEILQSKKPRSGSVFDDGVTNVKCGDICGDLESI